jgi:hypothetical protein
MFGISNPENVSAADKYLFFEKKKIRKKEE